MLHFPPNPFRLAGLVALLGASACSPRGVEHAATGNPPKASLCTLEGPRVLDASSRVSGSVALARHGERTLAFVADEDGERLLVRDLDGPAGDDGSALALSGPPASVLVHDSGALVVAVPARSRLEVVHFDGKRLQAACSVPTPSEPVAAAVSEDGRQLLVASAWGRSLTAFETRSFHRAFRIPLARDPRAVVIDDERGRAFVSHGTGGVVTVVDLARQRTHEISVDAPLPDHIALRRKELEDSFVPLIEQADAEERLRLQGILRAQLATLDRPARFGTHGYALALSVEPRGRVFVPQTEVDPGLPDQRTAGYGQGGVAAATPSVAVIDQESLRALENSVQPPAAWITPEIIAGREACRLPRAATVDGESGLLLVACLGADVLVGYDAASPNPIDAEALRVPVAAGPTGVAVDAVGRRAVVWSQFERTLGVVPLPRAGAPLSPEDVPPREIAFAATEVGPSPEVALGRRLFYASDDPRIASDGRSCANCHIGGRDDGLTWSTPNGPRRTKNLANSLQGSAPYSWDGDAPTLHDQLQSTFQRLGGQGGLRGPDLDALLAYVAVLPAPPRSDEDVDPALVRRGEALFHSEQAACATCHMGKVGTDQARHDVSSAFDPDVTNEFDTPTLRFLEGRAPFFHDGRYATLEALLRDSDGKMGHTAHLSASDVEAMIAYLETL